MVAPNLIALEATDVTGQKRFRLGSVTPNTTVAELAENLAERMRLPATDSQGRAVTYHLRHEREGRHLHASEIVGEALHSEDRVRLQPNIDAGARP